ncbi:hypothetical protein KAS08_00780 [Candidatus Pacearchaeota archaeon]|nr:hypothetical protein [Candidatus Pacearchaeota archaeon]
MEILRIHKQLKNIILKANASITSRKVACLLITKEEKIYEGYNIEKVVNILHAENMAVNNAIKNNVNFKIKEIHLMANGKPQNVKRSIPCENCSKMLKPYCEKDSKIMFHLFTDPNMRYTLHLKDIINSYSSFNNIPLLSNKRLFDRHFENYLTQIDKNFLTEFIKTIKPECSELYITGSASKRGGPKQLLAKKIIGTSYLDIDLIAIFSIIDKNEINKIVKKAILESLNKIGFDAENLLEETMPSYILEEDLTKKDSKDFIFRKTYWIKGMQLEIMPPEYKKHILMPSAIDLSVGRNIKGTATKKYLDKNWIVKLF